MRLLFLTPTYYPLVGGAERAIHELATRLVARHGHEVQIVTPFYGGPRREEPQPGLRIERVGPGLRRQPFRFFLNQWAARRWARRRVPSAGFDLAVLFYGIHASLVQPLLQKALKLPVVISEFHQGTGRETASGLEDRRYLFPLLRRSYQRADAVFSNSKATAEFVAEVSGLKESGVIPQGADPDAFRPDQRSEAIHAKFSGGSPLLLSISRLSKRKNIEEMLEAMRLLMVRGQDFRLSIVGDGPERAHLETLAKELGLGDRVRFLGYLEEQPLLALRASSDLFLSTARYEGFGLSLVESMASGVPVVSYDAAGTQDFLVDGKTGYVTRHSPGAFADAVASLLGDSGARTRMSTYCREVVVRQFNWDRYADDHDRLFRKIVGAKQGR